MPNILFSAREELWPQYRPALEAAFAAAGLQVDLSNHTDDPAAVDYLIYAPARDDDDLSVFTNLKLIQSLWAGPDKLLRNPTLTQPLARMVDPGMTKGMVEYVLGHILHHHLGTQRFAMAEPGEWHALLSPPLASSRTVAFLGIGELGMACAMAAQAQGFNVIGWSRRAKEDAPMACYSGEDGLRDVLAQADVIVTLMPSTPATRHIINAEVLGMMKLGAALINPGRGELIDDDALIAAVESGQIGSASLDVFHVEPLPACHPYWRLKQVLITPHVAAETRIETAAPVVAENIRRAEAGEEVLYLVDRAQSY